MNVKYLTTILLSSVVSALTVFILLGRLGQDESGSRTQQEERSQIKKSPNPKKPQKVRRPTRIPGSIGTPDPDEPKVEQGSGEEKRDVHGHLGTSIDCPTGSNSRNTAQTFYVTRNRYCENHGGTVSTTTTCGNHVGEYGIEVASVTYVPDPVNPQSGMIANAYVVEECMDKDMLQKSNLELPEMSSVKTLVDKGDTFSLNLATDTDATVMRWDGFIRCKRTVTCTFLLSKGNSDDWDNGYSIRINNHLIGTGYGQNAVDVALKVGWNRVEIVCQFKDKTPLNISLKPKESLKEPRSLTPAMMFHDQKPEYVW